MKSVVLAMKQLLMLAFLLPCFSAAHKDTTRLSEEGGMVLLTDSEHQQYATLGAPKVILRCPIPEGTGTVQWKVNSTLLAATSREAREDGSLVLSNASLAEEGEYHCHNPITGRVLHSVHLRLGYPPGKPCVHCWSANYPGVINCTWRLETDTHLETSFVATYRHGMEGERRECVRPTTGANSCSIAAVQMFSIVPYVLNVTATNPLGMATRLFPFFVDQIIKPDPPEGLKISPIPRERKKLLLEWKIPSSWLLPEYFPLKYSIRYWQDGRSNSKTISSVEQTSFILTGVRTGVTYHAQVAAKEFLDNGKYSDWSSPATGTVWAQ